MVLWPRNHDAGGCGEAGGLSSQQVTATSLFAIFTNTTLCLNMLSLAKTRSSNFPFICFDTYYSYIAPSLYDIQYYPSNTMDTSHLVLIQLIEL